MTSLTLFSTTQFFLDDEDDPAASISEDPNGRQSGSCVSTSSEDGNRKSTSTSESDVAASVSTAANESVKNEEEEEDEEEEDQEDQQHVSSANKPPQKRHKFSPEELNILERRFHRDDFPSKIERIKLGNVMKLDQKQIMIWFQNRRSRFKKRGESDPAYRIRQENKRLRMLTAISARSFPAASLTLSGSRFPDDANLFLNNSRDQGRQYDVPSYSRMTPSDQTPPPNSRFNSSSLGSTPYKWSSGQESNPFNSPSSVSMVSPGSASYPLYSQNASHTMARQAGSDQFASQSPSTAISSRHEHEHDQFYSQNFSDTISGRMTKPDQNIFPVSPIPPTSDQHYRRNVSSTMIEQVGSVDRLNNYYQTSANLVPSTLRYMPYSNSPRTMRDRYTSDRDLYPNASNTRHEQVGTFGNRSAYRVSMSTEHLSAVSGAGPSRSQQSYDHDSMHTSGRMPQSSSLLKAQTQEADNRYHSQGTRTRGSQGSSSSSSLAWDQLQSMASYTPHSTGGGFRQPAYVDKSSFYVDNMNLSVTDRNVVPNNPTNYRQNPSFAKIGNYSAAVYNPGSDPAYHAPNNMDLFQQHQQSRNNDMAQGSAGRTNHGTTGQYFQQNNQFY